jgi:hypothetical protein
MSTSDGGRQDGEQSPAVTAVAAGRSCALPIDTEIRVDRFRATSSLAVIGAASADPSQPSRAPRRSVAVAGSPSPEVPEANVLHDRFRHRSAARDRGGAIPTTAVGRGRRHPFVGGSEAPPTVTADAAP